MATTNIDPKRASFLGLATETRLHIYSYLLIPHNTPDQEELLRERRHCCAFPHSRKNYRHPHDDVNVDVACDCRSKNLHPALLSVNRQIFNETARILYENMEFQVRLPHFVTFRDSPLQNAIDALPKYSHKWIKRMVIVGTPGEASEKHRDSGKMTWRWPMEQYADAISATFPNVQHIRLHIDFGSSKGGRRTAVETFGFVMGVPKLEVVEVEIDAQGMSRGQGSWARCMSERIVGYVEQAIRCYQKEEIVEVREVLSEVGQVPDLSCISRMDTIV